MELGWSLPRLEGNDGSSGQDERLEKKLLEGEFKDVCESVDLFNCENYVTIEHYIVHYLNHGTEYSLILYAIALLYIHIQKWHTGPALSYDPLSYLGSHKSDFQRMLKNILDKDGVQVSRFQDTDLLAIASEILHFEYAGKRPLLTLWRSRVDFIHQQLLDENISSLHTSIIGGYSNFWEYCRENMSSDVAGSVLIEYGLAMGYYDRRTQGLDLIKLAGDMMGLEWILTGLMGRRTKYQQAETSQLIVLAKSRDRNDDKSHTKSVKSTNVPVAFPKISLDDDTLLDRIAYKEVESNQVPIGLQAIDPNDQGALDPLDCCVLLAYSAIMNNAPPDALSDEQVAPFVNRVIDSQVNWSINSTALLMRCRIESKRNRTRERSLLQLQVIVDQIVDELQADGYLKSSSFIPKPHSEGDLASATERLRYFWQLGVPSIWQLEAELAKRYMGVGALRSAIQIYERLELWEEVAMCLAASGQENQAIQVLLDQLKKDPMSLKYWTLLGDVEQNPSHWLKATEISNGKYAKAQRSLGRYHYQKGDINLAAEAFQASVKINPLVFSAWYMYGCCCIDTSDWEEAAEAFRRCVAIDQDDGESWNNLATAYLKSSPKRSTDAYKALGQAIKYKYDSWRVWLNYALVAASLQEWFPVIQAQQRIIDLTSAKQGEASIDVDIVDLLVSNVFRSDSQTISSAGLLTALDNLFANIIPLITSNPRLWHIVSIFYTYKKNYRLALDANEKAFRLAQKEQTPHLVILHLSNLVESYENFGELEDESGVICKDWKYRCKSALRLVKSRFSDLISDQDLQALEKIGKVVSA